MPRRRHGFGPFGDAPASKKSRGLSRRRELAQWKKRRGYRPGPDQRRARFPFEKFGTELKAHAVFGANFLRRPTRNASIFPSSRFASGKLVAGIDFDKVNTVVELGAGTGPVTVHILRHCKPGAKVILMEIEPAYVKTLQKKFGARVIIENASAHLLGDVLAKHNIDKVDLIVSTLPFLPEHTKRPLFETLTEQTSKGAILRCLTYMPPVMKLEYKPLPVTRKGFVLRNFPPMWVYGIN